MCPHISSLILEDLGHQGAAVDEVAAVDAARHHRAQPEGEEVLELAVGGVAALRRDAFPEAPADVQDDTCRRMR